MIGIIVTGHLNFASGLQSALAAISGDEGQVGFVDFPEDIGTDELEQRLKTTAAQVDSGDGVLFLADIPGGSPFQHAVNVANTMSNADVISGTNLVMAVEACLERDDLNMVELVAHVQEVGRDSIMSFASQSRTTSAPAAEGGI